tara:strand:- start:8412 stop:9548 length:1137 start_codon:yes stop_codon:yes gene_type:complete
MTIAIDFVATDTNSGTKTYILNFCEEIDKLPLEYNIIIYLTKNYYNQISISKKKNKKIKYVIKSNIFSNIFLRLIWMQFILLFNLKREKVRTLFSPMNFCPLLSNVFKIKIILGLHSNLPWVYFNLMPGSKIRNYLTKKFSEISLRLSSKIIVCSNYAKYEISKLLKIDENKLEVAYLGIDNFYLENQKKNELFLNNFKYENYIFSVMSTVKYHNIINLLKCFKKIVSKKNSNYKLIIATQVLDKNYFKQIEKFISDNSLINNVIILKNLDKKYLKNLYKYASLYVFTSYTEVFGLTTLEAMSQGAKVLVSNTSALPEINGQAAIYFDPDDILDLELKINNNLSETKVKKINEDLQLNYIKKFSWKNTVINTLSIISK